jgi:hypothetical protein
MIIKFKRIELIIDAANRSVYVMADGQAVSRFTNHKLAEAYALSLLGF